MTPRPRDEERASGKRLSKAAAAPAENDNALVVTLTRGQLVELMREAVETALSMGRPAPVTDAPVLLDRQQLARALGCSAAQIDKLKKRGMPFVRIGEHPRFSLEAAIAWLESQQGATKEEPET